MSRMIDRVFCWLMAFAALGHFFGTIKFAQFGTGLFVWSLSGVLAAALLAAINFLRNFRPQDRTMAGVALAGNLSWVGIVLLFGLSIGDLLDFRVLFHGVAALGLSYFSFRSLKKTGNSLRLYRSVSIVFPQRGTGFDWNKMRI